MPALVALVATLPAFTGTSSQGTVASRCENESIIVASAT